MNIALSSETVFVIARARFGRNDENKISYLSINLKNSDILTFSALKTFKAVERVISLSALSILPRYALDIFASKARISWDIFALVLNSLIFLPTCLHKTLLRL